MGRRCGECRLSEKSLCPSAVVEKKKKVVIKKAKDVVAIKEEGNRTIEREQVKESVIVKEEDELAEDVE